MPETEQTTGDALVEIERQGGGGALKLVGDLMERNAKDLDWTFEQMYEAEVADHARTKERLATKQRQLDTIYDRIHWLLGGELPREEELA